MEKEYETFIEELRQMLLDATGMREEQIFYKEKASGITETGDRLFIEYAVHEDGKEVCGIFIQELYENYQAGASMEGLAGQILHELELAKKEKYFEKTKNLLDYEKVRQDLFVRLLNAEQNRAELNHCVCRFIGDIAQVLYMRIGETQGRVTSVKIRREYMECWEENEEKVFEEALRNTLRISPPRIYCWEKLIDDPDYDGEIFLPQDKKLNLKKNAMGNCLSTSERTNGAVAVFLPGVAKRLSELMEQDLYLAFTSVHEVMIHNAKMTYPEELEEVLADTIQKATPREDYLSSRIYRYCRSTDTIICVSEE